MSEIVQAPVARDEVLPVEQLHAVRLDYDTARLVLASPAWDHEPDFPGPEGARVVWRMRDANTAAILVVWDVEPWAPTLAEVSKWAAWYQDGPGHAGSGRHMFDVLLLEMGGELAG